MTSLLDGKKIKYVPGTYISTSDKKNMQPCSKFYEIYGEIKFPFRKPAWKPTCWFPGLSLNETSAQVN